MYISRVTIVSTKGSWKFRKEMQMSFLATLAVGTKFRNYKLSVLLLGVTSSTVQSATVSIFTEVLRTTTLQFIPWHPDFFRGLLRDEFRNGLGDEMGLVTSQSNDSRGCIHLYTGGAGKESHRECYCLVWAHNGPDAGQSSNPYRSTHSPTRKPFPSRSARIIFVSNVISKP